ncbi:hypothetical protein HYT32_00735 [Candidatus Roizmanbacteria bacterium]|nr:hypothetical protein [Candidatus Roizmanbacteria bacterium]
MREIRARLNSLYKRSSIFANRKPFTSFLIALAILFLVILANFLTAPKPQEIKKEDVAKEVDVYRIGKAAKTNVLGQVEKTGVITIAAQTSGIVSFVHVSEGDSVAKGRTLVSLASNYIGGNTSSISRQLAAVQYQNTKDTYDAQKNLLDKQKEIAEKTDANSDELRHITDSSLSDTRSLLDLNNGILSAIDANLLGLEAANISGVNDELIFSTKQLKSQLLSGNNLLKANLRTSEFQAAGDKPPAQLSDLQKDTTLGQLDLQLKALDLSLEVSRLQLALAQVAEAAMFPQSPFGGTIERVHVYPGQMVNSGNPLVTLSGDTQEVSIILKVPAAIARRVSFLEDSIVYINGKQLSAKPDFVSDEATDGQLYAILFTIPSDYHSLLVSKEYIRVELPIGAPDTGGAISFVPIDSVFQTQDQALVYVVEEGKAKSKNVILGQVVGGDVEVLKGLTQGDEIILDRNILAGDRVSVKN